MLDRIEAAFLRITEFTADASHELRTPVSLIRTEAELALRRSRGEIEYKESLRHILLQGVVESWQQVAGIRNLEFSANIVPKDSFVIGDESALRRVADILLDNAFKYTPSPGRVAISLERKGDNVVLVVQDTGVGIPEGEKGKIFERFYRVDKARSGEQGGAG